MSATTSGDVRTVRPDTGAVLVNGVAAPLEGISRWDPLQGGWGFLTWTGSVFHPGMDLNAGSGGNADCGKRVYAPCAGTVLAALPWDGWTTGEGNHLWVALDDPVAVAPAWLHVMHLQEFRAQVGQRVGAGDVLGLCGRTGNWDWCHAHTELTRHDPQGNWWLWPSGWSREAVAAAWFDPFWWWTETVKRGAAVAPVPPPVLTPLTRAYFEMLSWEEPAAA